MATPSSNLPSPHPSPPRLLFRAASLLVARARFFLLVGGALLLMAVWPKLLMTWEQLTRPAPPADSISHEIEYWCPMCPGVASDWPSKCPVCHMTLIRRQKGDMTPLPDGVVARVQLSPYRLQLAGIRTTAVEYRQLMQEVTLAGLIEATAEGKLVLAAPVFVRDASLLSVGRDAEVICDALPVEVVPGRLLELAPGRGEFRARIAIDVANDRLRAGQYARAVFRIPFEMNRDIALARWRDQTTVELVANSLGGVWEPSGSAALIDAAVRFALHQKGRILAVPESAVIDTGTRQVVFVEQMPGMFHAVEVHLGRRCGESYPVQSGLEPTWRVVTAGAVLLDAETRLDPSVAASYFGAGSRSGSSPAPPGGLSPEDRLLAQRQKICPVTEAALDSMGGPVRVLVNGQPVFICCEGCRATLLKDPGKYLARLPNK